MSSPHRVSNLCNPLSTNYVQRSASRSPTPAKEITPVACMASLTTPGYYRKSKNDDWKPVNQSNLFAKDYDRSNVKLKKDNKKKVLKLNLFENSDDSDYSEDEKESYRTRKKSSSSDASDEGLGDGSVAGSVSGDDGERIVQNRKLRTTSSSSNFSSDDEERRLPTMRDCASDDEGADIWCITDDVLKVSNTGSNKHDDVSKILEDGVLLKGKTETELRSEREDPLIFRRIREIKGGMSAKKDKRAMGSKKNGSSCHDNHSYNRQYATKQKSRTAKFSTPTNQKGEHGDGKATDRDDIGLSIENQLIQDKGTVPVVPPQSSPCVQVSLNQNNNKPISYADACKKLPASSCRNIVTQSTNHQNSPFGRVSPIVTKLPQALGDQGNSSPVLRHQSNEVSSSLNDEPNTDTKPKTQSEAEKDSSKIPCEIFSDQLCATTYQSNNDGSKGEKDSSMIPCKTLSGQSCVKAVNSSHDGSEAEKDSSMIPCKTLSDNSCIEAGMSSHDESEAEKDSSMILCKTLSGNTCVKSDNSSHDGSNANKDSPMIPCKTLSDTTCVKAGTFNHDGSEAEKDLSMILCKTLSDTTCVKSVNSSHDGSKDEKDLSMIPCKTLNDNPVKAVTFSHGGSEAEKNSSISSCTTFSGNTCVKADRSSHDAKSDCIRSVAAPNRIETYSGLQASPPNLDDPAIVCVSASPPCDPPHYPFPSQEYYPPFAPGFPVFPPFATQNDPYAHTNYVYSLLSQYSPADLLKVMYELKIREAMNSQNFY